MSDDLCPSVAPHNAAAPPARSYRIIAKIGAGGMANVSLAFATGTAGVEKLVVLKSIREDLVTDVDLRAMFLNEARLAMRLNHPNIVHTYEVREANGKPFIVMEYLEGQSLSALIARAGRAKFPLTVGLRVLCDTLRGLHAAHSMLDYDGAPMPLVHRDVSPQNVFVTYTGHAKVVDFGIAKVASASGETAHGVVKGKVGYMAPEQVRGRAIDARADVFAVGVMLWEMLAGRRLAPSQLGEVAILTQRLHGLDPPIHEVAPDAPREVLDLCARAMATDPAERFPSAASMATSIEAYLGSLPEGQRGDAVEVATFMQSLFATENAKTRETIELAMRSEGSSEKLVSALVPPSRSTFDGLEAEAPEPQVPTRKVAATWRMQLAGRASIATGILGVALCATAPLMAPGEALRLRQNLLTDSAGPVRTLQVVTGNAAASSSAVSLGARSQRPHVDARVVPPPSASSRTSSPRNAEHPIDESNPYR